MESSSLKMWMLQWLSTMCAWDSWKCDVVLQASCMVHGLLAGQAVVVFTFGSHEGSRVLQASSVHSASHLFSGSPPCGMQLHESEARSMREIQESRTLFGAAMQILNGSQNGVRRLLKPGMQRTQSQGSDMEAAAGDLPSEVEPASEAQEAMDARQSGRMDCGHLSPLGPPSTGNLTTELPVGIQYSSKTFTK